MNPCSRVTSLAEVWIEITSNVLASIGGSGHFPRGSVDWNRYTNVSVSTVMVTSLAEVWIEIRIKRINHYLTFVTSLAEVWIEICRKHLLPVPAYSHFPRGSVDWNKKRVSPWLVWLCHFPRGSVDWNSVQTVALDFRSCHFPRGSVDWNRINGPLLLKA